METSDCRIGYRRFWAPCATRHYQMNMVVVCSLALANERLRIGQNPEAYSGNVMDQINENMANCIQGRQNRSHLQPELSG